MLAFEVAARFASDRLTSTVSIRQGQDQELPTWRVEQLIEFIGLIDWFVEDLQKAYEQERVMTVAWLARNLLEIFIWVRYCSLSESHAKRFHEDAMRDFYGYGGMAS